MSLWEPSHRDENYPWKQREDSKETQGLRVWDIPGGIQAED